MEIEITPCGKDAIVKLNGYTQVNEVFYSGNIPWYEEKNCVLILNEKSIFIVKHKKIIPYDWKETDKKTGMIIAEIKNMPSVL